MVPAAVCKVMQRVPLAQESDDIEQARQDGVQYPDCKVGYMSVCQAQKASGRTVIKTLIKQPEDRQCISQIAQRTPAICTIKGSLAGAELDYRPSDFRTASSRGRSVKEPTQLVNILWVEFFPALSAARKVRGI